MALINPKPRFAYDDATDMIYDYVGQKDVALVAKFNAKDGVWNLLEVKRLILAGQTIESARVGYLKAPGPPPKLEVVKPTPSPVSPAPAASTAATVAPIVPGQGLTATQLQSLKLSAIQAAAMGIKHEEMASTGVTAEQIADWGLTPARANALKLNTEQRTALGIPAA